MESVLQDLRYAVRSLRTRPGFAVAAIATLALGVGASTAVFSLVDAALLRPLPFASADRLVVLWGVAGPERDLRGASMLEIADWRDGAPSLERVSAFDQISLNLRHADDAERLTAEVVSPSFFPLLGVQAARGRTFLPEEDEAIDASPVAVISHGLWQTRFAGDPALVGRTIVLNDREMTVVGIMPEGFRGFGFGADVWIPSTMQTLVMSRGAMEERGNRWLVALAQLRPGVTTERAQRELDAVASRLQREYPATNADRGVRVMSLRENYLGATERLLVVIFGAVLLFLLLSCANVTGLQLVRAAGRRREIALRFALGARRDRIVRQLLTEALVLSAAGGVAGVLVAIWGVSALLPLVPEGLLPDYATPAVDGRVLAFGLALTTICGVAFGLVPALRSSSGNLGDALREGSRSAAGGLGRINRLGAQQVLVVAEVAIALVLLIGAGLMARTFARELAVSPGFRPEGVMTARLTLPTNGYDADARRRFAVRLEEQLAALPGVAAASLSSDLPFQGSTSASMMVLPSVDPESRVRYYRHSVSPEFFATLGIPIVRGRTFTSADRDGAPPVAIISEAMANRFWPGRDAVGERIALGADIEATIVGVVGTARFRDLRTDLAGRVEPDVYFPLLQRPDRSFEIAVRPREGATITGNELRAAVAAVDPTIPIYSVSLMRDDMRQLSADARFGSVILALFALVAAVLAAIGIYGVIAFIVSLSRREIAVRMALGASSGRVVRLVVRNGVLLAALGVVLGLATATVATRALADQLFGVEPLDVGTFAAMAVSLLILAAAAIWIPAARATRVSPQSALKAE